MYVMLIVTRQGRWDGFAGMDLLHDNLTYLYYVEYLLCVLHLGGKGVREKGIRSGFPFHGLSIVGIPRPEMIIKID